MRLKDLARAVLLLGAVGAVVALLLPAGGRRSRVLGNERSRVYHRPGCRFAPAETQAVPFPSPAAAEAEGYRPCKACTG